MIAELTWMKMHKHNINCTDTGLASAHFESRRNVSKICI